MRTKIEESHARSFAIAQPDLPQLIVPRRFIDERGWFSETFNQNRLREIGISCQFVQDNWSYSKKAGTVRGLHFQHPPAAQAKLVSVSKGRILDFAVDIRRASPTYGRYVSAELSSQNGRQLYVPVGFAHGFCTLEDDVQVTYKVSDFYAPAYDSGVLWNDTDIALPWPFKAEDIALSEKDRRLPPLKDFASPFVYDGNELAPLSEVGSA